MIGELVAEARRHAEHACRVCLFYVRRISDRVQNSCDALL